MGWDKKVHAFTKGVSSKVKVMVWLELELAFFEVTAQHLSHYAKVTLTYSIRIFIDMEFSFAHFKKICVRKFKYTKYFWHVLREREREREREKCVSETFKYTKYFWHVLREREREKEMCVGNI